MPYEIFHRDAFAWMEERESSSIEAIVTDPPYGVVEYRPDQLDKMRNGRGGIWRIPPSFDGAKRIPQPRFTVLTDKDFEVLEHFFLDFGNIARRVMVPGAHLIIASNTLLYPHVAMSLKNSGLEFRGTIARQVRTMRGGDRPKGAHEEFPMVSSAPRSCWEPWLLFRKPFDGRLQDNLRTWGTGGLRRFSNETPMLDLVASRRTPRSERRIAPHPSLKPQDLMRTIVKSVLPLRKGVVLDPFMGAGSTIAAAHHLGYTAIGVEVDEEYFQMAEAAIPILASLKVVEVSTPSSAQQVNMQSSLDRHIVSKA